MSVCACVCLGVAVAVAVAVVSLCCGVLQLLLLLVSFLLYCATGLPSCVCRRLTGAVCCCLTLQCGTEKDEFDFSKKHNSIVCISTFLEVAVLVMHSK